MKRVVYNFTAQVLAGKEDVGYSVPHANAKAVMFAQRRPDDNWPTLWCEVDLDAMPGTTTFVIRGTGHPIQPNLDPMCMGVQDGSLVWHLYQVVM